MITEDVEFQLSQYVDGTLSAPERKAVDDLVQTDPQAKALLSDFQRLNRLLIDSSAGPGRLDVRWEQLADHISRSVADRTAPVIAGRIGFAGTWRLRIAAAVLLTATAALVVRREYFGKQPTLQISAPSSIVVGPQSEVAKGPAITDVTICPSAVAQRNDPARYGQASINRAPSKVVIGMNAVPLKGDQKVH